MTTDQKPTARGALVTVIAQIVVFAAATALLSWWGVAIAALIWGAIDGQRYHGAFGASAIGPVLSAAAGVIAWGGFLLWDAVRGPAALLVHTLGELAGIPGSILVLVTLLFVAVVAWSATAVGYYVPTAVSHFSRFRQ